MPHTLPPPHAAIARLAVLTEAMHRIQCRPFTPAYIDALTAHALRNLSADELHTLASPYTATTFNLALAAIAVAMLGPENPALNHTNPAK